MTPKIAHSSFFEEKEGEYSTCVGVTIHQNERNLLHLSSNKLFSNPFKFILPTEPILPEAIQEFPLLSPPLNKKTNHETFANTTLKITNLQYYYQREHNVIILVKETIDRFPLATSYMQKCGFQGTHRHNYTIDYNLFITIRL